MGDTSNIEWTEATWNPWHGCHRISPSCDHCYMFAEKKQYGHDGDMVVRSKTKFNDPLKWARTGKMPKLCFTCSWSDWFINEADPWRPDAWGIIHATPEINYQILTKRAGRILSHLPPDWGPGYPNCWLGVSVEAPEQLSRIAMLRAAPAHIRFVSFEPVLADIGPVNLEGIHWAIIGGESGHHARSMNLQWARNLVAQCRAQNVKVFMKQLGAKPVSDHTERQTAQHFNEYDGLVHIETGRKGDDPAHWPEDLRVREYPEVRSV